MLKKVLMFVLSLALVFTVTGQVMAMGGYHDPAPYNAFANPVAGPGFSGTPEDNFGGDSILGGKMEYNFGGAGQAGGIADVNVSAHDWAYGDATLSGGTDPVIGGGFLYNENGVRIAGVGSSQTVSSYAAGYGIGGSEYLGCGKYDLPEITTDMTVSGTAYNEYEAFASAQGPGQSASAIGGGWNEATYWGQDFEGNDWLIVDLPIGTNSLEGSATVMGGAIVGVYRNGKASDINNSITAFGITGGTGMADVVEPGLFGNSQPDNGEYNTSMGAGGVAGAAYSSNPQGGWGSGSFSASYMYNGSNNGAINPGDNYGVAKGKTTVTLGNGTINVHSSASAYSTGGSIPPQQLN